MKRFVSVFLAFLILLSSMCFGCIDALALPAVDMPGGSFEVVPGGLDDVPRDITWTAELLYSFELFMNSVGVRVTSKAVPAVALAWEAQAKVDSPEFYAELAELSQMNGIERLDTLFGHTWAGSIRDFCLSDACTGYGTANFSFGSGVVDIVNKHLDVAFKGVYTPYSEKVTSVVDYNYCFSYSFVVNPGMAKEIIYYYDLYAPMGVDIVCMYPSQSSNGFSTTSGIRFAGFANKGTSFYDDWLKVVISQDVRQTGGGYVFSHYKGASNDMGSTQYYYAINNSATYWNSFPYPVFKSSAYVQDYVLKGVADGLLHLSGFEDLYTPEKIASAVPELQAKAINSLPTIKDFVIPATTAEREAILGDVRNVDTAEALAKALLNAGIIAETDVDNPPAVDNLPDVNVEPSLGGISKVLSSILSAIVSIPDKIITGLKELLISLFVPSPDYFSNKIDSLLSLLKSVLPYADYINMLETIGNFSGGELKDITVTIMGATATVVSFGSFREILPTVRSWARGVFFVFMVIYYINQIYKLIRNTRLYEGMLPPSGKG